MPQHAPALVTLVVSGILIEMLFVLSRVLVLFGVSKVQGESQKQAIDDLDTRQLVHQGAVNLILILATMYVISLDISTILHDPPRSWRSRIKTQLARVAQFLLIGAALMEPIDPKLLNTLNTAVGFASVGFAGIHVILVFIDLRIDSGLQPPTDDGDLEEGKKPEPKKSKSGKKKRSPPKVTEPAPVMPKEQLNGGSYGALTDEPEVLSSFGPPEPVEEADYGGSGSKNPWEN